MTQLFAPRLSVLALSILTALWCSASGNIQVDAHARTDWLDNVRRRPRLTSDFAVHVTGGEQRARQIALEDGFVFLESVC